MIKDLTTEEKVQKFIEEVLYIEEVKYSKWLSDQGRKPKKFIAILNGLTNDLKKIGALKHDDHLFLINDVSVLTKLLSLYLEHPPYKAKNERGNNYYSAPFKKYIKFRTETK